MYYRIDEKKYRPSKTIDFEGNSIQINVDQPSARFIINNDEKINCIDELVNMLGIKPKEKKKFKRKILYAVKQIFIDLETTYPDSSTGMIPFITGDNYRVPSFDGYYQFELKPVKNYGLTLEYLSDDWSLCFILIAKNKEMSIEDFVKINPQSLIDLKANNDQGTTTFIEYISRSGNKEKIKFEAFPSVNRIDIYIGDNKVIKANLEKIQLMLDVIKSRIDVLMAGIKKK